MMTIKLMGYEVFDCKTAIGGHIWSSECTSKGVVEMEGQLIGEDSFIEREEWKNDECRGEETDGSRDDQMKGILQNKTEGMTGGRTW